MVAYLERNPPARRQFYRTRQQPVTAIGLHTAENHPDLVVPDSGAEGVANFIRTRDTPGSYHSVCDSDSTVHVCEYRWTAFHIVGFNSGSFGLSFATRAEQWEYLPQAWRDGAISQGAVEAARMCQWVRGTYGWTIPPRLLTRTQALGGLTGFAYHGIMDPRRRTDPGTGFPWPQFARLYVEECTKLGVDVGPVDLHNPMTGGTVTEYQVMVGDATERLQRLLLGHGADLGSTGPNSDGVDRDPGPSTLNAAAEVIETLTDRLAEAGRPGAVPADVAVKADAYDKIVAALEALRGTLP